MSYPRDLDEYTDHDLIGELHQRATDRARGLCDYCHQPSASTAPCRFAIRHALAGFDVSHNGAASGQADPTDTEEAVPK